MTTPTPFPPARAALAHAFEDLDEAAAAYVAMRHAMTRMALADLQIKGAADIDDASEMLSAFDAAADAFLGATATLERLGFWAIKDALYMPDGPQAA